MDETQDRLLRALSKDGFGDLDDALNSWTEGLSMIEQLDNLQYCVKVVQEKIEPVFKAVLNLRDTSGSIKVEDQVLEALRSVKKNEGLIKAFYRSILHHINSQNDDIYRYKPPKDITLIKEEINGWTRIVCALFRKNNEVLVRGSLDGRDPTDRWDDQGNSLHLASGSDCHQVFQEIVNDIKARSIDNPQLSEKWFSTANKGGRTALSLAISRFNKPTVEVLIKEAKHDLNVCWTSYEKYPIHDLVCDAAELTKSYDYYTEACLDILRAIVQACPESLTQQCKASDSVGTYSGGPPFQMAKDAHEVNPDSKLLAALVNEIEDLCLRHLDGEDRAKALDLSKDRITDLDLSDFDSTTLGNSINNFETFVKNFPKTIEQAKLKLNKKLSVLRLPDMTNTWDTNHLESTKMWVEHFSKHLVTVETFPVPANQLSILNRQVSSAFTNDLRHLLNLRRSSDLESTQKAIIELLAAFKKLKVIKIMKLVARDNIRNPMEDRQIIETVRQFRVEELDWYKLDFDIYDLIPPDRLSNPQRQDFPGAKLRKIHLYTKGHQGVLHHWSGGDGLISLPQLQDVFITVIYGDERKSTIDKYARTENVEEKEKIFPEFHEVKVFHEARIAQEAAGKSRKLNVVISPGCRHKPRDIGSTKPENAADKFFEIFNRSSSLLKSLDSATPDRKIRVAVIDNGIDTGMGDLGGQVKQGHSFVECGVIQHWHADLNTLTKGRLPWFTATDPHGTQMAGLIAKINCLCELYVYRIHTNRHDIRMNAAKEALQMAIDEGVDIVNLSWASHKPHPGIEKLIRKATNVSEAEHKILFFCAKSDEPYAPNSYPADYKETISVAAATSWGRIGIEASKPPSLIVQGENLAAAVQSYYVGDNGPISGSSVATALASGMASLLLMMVMVRCGDNRWTKLKDGETMIALLRDMSSNTDSDSVFVDVDMFKEETVLANHVKGFVDRR